MNHSDISERSYQQSFRISDNTIVLVDASEIDLSAWTPHITNVYSIADNASYNGTRAYASSNSSSNPKHFIANPDDGLRNDSNDSPELGDTVKCDACFDKFGRFYTTKIRMLAKKQDKVKPMLLGLILVSAMIRAGLYSSYTIRKLIGVHQHRSGINSY